MPTPNNDDRINSPEDLRKALNAAGLPHVPIFLMPDLSGKPDKGGPDTSQNHFFTNARWVLQMAAGFEVVRKLDEVSLVHKGKVLITCATEADLMLQLILAGGNANIKE